MAGSRQFSTDNVSPGLLLNIVGILITVLMIYFLGNARF